MAIDWTATGEMIANFGSWAEAGAVAYAAHKAADTFSEWRKRRSTEREEEIARRSLVAVFKVQEAYQSIRAPLQHSSELAAAGEKLASHAWYQALTPQQQDRHKSAQVYVMRLNYFQERFDELAECIPLARAIIGEDLAKALTSLHRQAWIIDIEASSYADDTGADREFSMRLRQNLNDHTLTGEGAVTMAIKEAVAIAERTCLAVLRPDGHRQVSGRATK